MEDNLGGLMYGISFYGDLETLDAILWVQYQQFLLVTIVTIFSAYMMCKLTFQSNEDQIGFY